MRFGAPPSAIALRHRGGVVGVADLDRRCDALARRLADHDGIVAVRAAGTPDTVAVLVAGLRAGRPVALLPATATPAETAVCRRLLGRAVEVDGQGDVLWSAGDVPARHHGDTALILFTSGSTGVPRAVQISRRHLDCHVENVFTTIELADACSMAVFVPLSYAFGVLGQVLPALRFGIEAHLMANVAEARGVIERGEARGVWSAVPAQWEGLLRACRPEPANFAGITHAVSAGAPLFPDLRRRLAERMPTATLYNSYGQTEAGPRLLAMNSRDPRFFGSGTGFAVPHAELSLGPGGELRARGPLVMLGYLGEAEHPTDGWHDTGDLAQADGDGLFTLLGRQDDVRKVGGTRISLIEVDEALRALPTLADAAADTEEDDVYGARLVAYVVPRASADGPRAGDLRDALARTLAWAKVPQRFFALPALPRTANGKIRRHALAGQRREAHEL